MWSSRSFKTSARLANGEYRSSWIPPFNSSPFNFSSWARSDLGLAALGVGAFTGCIYLFLHPNRMEGIIIDEKNKFPPTVRARLGQVLAVFWGGIGIMSISAAGVATLACSSIGTALPWLWPVGVLAQFPLLFATAGTSYSEHPGRKLAWWACYHATLGGLLAPIAVFAGRRVLLGATGITLLLTTGLCAIAANAHSHAFLGRAQDALHLGMAAVTAANIKSLVHPNDKEAEDVVIYGGLAVFSLAVLVDFQKTVLMAHAEDVKRWDPVDRGMILELDVLSIWLRIVLLYAKSQAEKNDEDDT